MKDDLLEYKEYLGTVHFSAEDQVFYGKIFGISDMVSFEGSSVTELISAFQESVEDYLITCKQVKKKPEKSYKGSFNVRIPPEIHKEVALRATRENISLNEFIKQVLTFAVNNPEKIKI